MTPLTPLVLVTSLWMAGSTAAAAPLDPLAFVALDAAFDPSGPVTVDTDTPSLSYEGYQVEGVFVDGVAVFTFGQVVLDEVVQGEGGAPFAILSHGDLRVDAEVRLYGRGSVPGPGGYGGGTASAGEAGEGPGGGDFTPGAGGGGFGGAGGDSQRGGDAGIAYGDLAVTLEGGSGGGKAVEISGENGEGGGGGGAIELGAVGRLDVAAGAVIVADGGDGETTDYNGGGGGAGGAIALHGRGGDCAGTLSARGGAGGDDGDSQLLAEGGGGGGGRIAMVDLDTACTTDVTPGAAPGGGEGQEGVVVFRQWEDPDDDGDGWTVGEGDCNDGDPEVFPGADDPPGDGVDGDCDGADGVNPTPTGTGTPGTDPTPGGTDTDGDGVPDGDPFAGEPLVVTSGCGCGGGGGSAGLVVGVAAAVALRRRRQSPAMAAVTRA